MKEISEKLRKKAQESFKPFVAQLVKEGLDRNMIIQASKRHVDAKIRDYYQDLKEPQSLGVSLLVAENNLKGKSDSKAELIFCRMLIKNEIAFKFQYIIGPYKVDYMVAEHIIVEIDGPQHNQKRDNNRDIYLRGMGYKILRVPIWVLATETESVINEIKSCQPPC